MKKFLISFDLNSSIDGYSQEYSKIESAISNFGQYCKPLDNVFIVTSNISHTEIRNAILKCSEFINAVIVVGLNGEYASFNYKNKNEKIAQIMG